MKTIQILSKIFSPTKIKWRLIRIKHLILNLENFLSNHPQSLRDVKSQLHLLDEKIAFLDEKINNSVLGDNIRKLLDKIEQSSSINEATLNELLGSKSKNKTNPLISIIVPTYNRASVITRALNSIKSQTYENYECLIIDDGSSDNTEAVLNDFLADTRFKYFKLSHQGASNARNYGHSLAQGELITFLDSDNEWLPEYLTSVTAAFENEPTVDAFYFALLIKNFQMEKSKVIFQDFSLPQLELKNFIDFNIFSIKNAALKSIGGFRNITKLVDWDLILRLARANYKIRGLPIIGARYHLDQPDRISRAGPYFSLVNEIRFFSKEQVTEAKRIKALYLLSNDSQFKQSKIQSEINALKKLGVDTEVWLEQNRSKPPTANGIDSENNLQGLIRDFKPNILHTHSLANSINFAKIAEENNLPLTVQANGSEPFDSALQKIEQLQIIKNVYIFPTLYPTSLLYSTKTVSLPIGYDSELFFCRHEKDRRLVLRTGMAQLNYDYETFIKTAQLCLQHRFILVLSTELDENNQLDTIKEINHAHGSPVEILTNLSQQKVSELMSVAGIYLHTISPTFQFGMPISIAEAMASGCYTLMRQLPATKEYGNRIASYYNTASEAALRINDSLNWSDEYFERTSMDSQRYAIDNLNNWSVYTTLVNDWVKLLSENNSLTYNRHSA